MKKKTSLQKMSRMISLILVLAALPFALMLLDKKLGPQRKVASDGSVSYEQGEQSDYDLSEATPEEFKKAFKYQILKNVSVENSSAGPLLRVGLFLIKNSSGNKVFVCDQYPTIDFIYAAEGVAFSGEVPQMIVRAPCVVSADQKYIEAPPIPFSTILQSSLKQYEFTAPYLNTNEQGRIYFRNVVEFWPKEWNFVGVKLYSQDNQSSLSISGYEVISVLGEPLTIQAQ